ncbi:MAG TPA: calcium/sodium antiporter [Paracoccaceae bacterium]|nr:calcium/sodium antiporter [Paracoccaceae bacterium]HMO72205.1 calcium/sodium antiporter [Paracoccaceae bacterium]
MLFDLLWAAAGLGLLVVAGDALVRGAVNLALRLGIPALIVGLTVVAFGTSAPELLVSIQAALADQDGIALGNVVGSNIANILLVLGLPALIGTIHSSYLELRRDYLTMIGATLLFLAVAWDGVLSRIDALVLLAGLALMLGDNIRSARRHRAEAAAANGAGEDELEGADAGMPGWKIAAFLVAGLIGLPIGADLLVDASVNIARAFGVSETVIGLTLVAVGTSLPELATSIAAAVRGKADVALGNVIGSNVFNLLAILGIASLVDTLAVPAEILSYDAWVMLGVSLLLVPFVFLRQDITRIVGVGLTAAYAAYAASLVM